MTSINKAKLMQFSCDCPQTDLLLSPVHPTATLHNQETRRKTQQNYRYPWQNVHHVLEICDFTYTMFTIIYSIPTTSLIAHFAIFPTKFPLTKTSSLLTAASGLSGIFIWTLWNFEWQLWSYSNQTFKTETFH